MITTSSHHPLGPLPLESRKTSYIVQNLSLDFQAQYQATLVYVRATLMESPASRVQSWVRREGSSEKPAISHTATRAPLEALPKPSQDSLQPVPLQRPLKIPEEPDSRRDRQVLYTDINLGWGKLIQYCTKTDLLALYVAALVLHPYYKRSWLKKKWNHRKACLRPPRAI
jgi:hypothetical protein